MLYSLKKKVINLSQNQDIKDFFINFLTGKSSKRFYISFYLPLIIFIFAAFLFLSAIFYPNYYFVDMDISNLGVPNLNPNGWFFWSIAMIFMGLTVIPFIPYLYRRLEGINRHFTRIGISFISIAVIGMIGLGTFPQYRIFLFLHQINAGFAFAGLYLTLFFLGFPVIKDKRIKRPFIGFFSFMGWSGIVGFLITQIYCIIQENSVFNYVNLGSQWFLNFAFWEWMLMVCVFSSFVILVNIVPDK